MQYFSIMDVLNGEGHLNKPIKNLIFGVAYFADLFLVSYFCVHVATICVVHYYAEAPFIHKGFFIRNDIWMSHCFEDMDL